MKFLVLILVATICLVSCVDEQEAKKQFIDYIRDFNKNYQTPAEHGYRFEAFKQSLDRIEILKADAQQRGVSVVYGLTKFSDMTPQEFETTMLTRRGRTYKDLPAADHNSCAAMARFPQLCKTRDNTTTMDWRQYGAVTEVKDQGQCGSCWSFGTTGDLEGSWYLSGNSLISLSEQQLVSCDNKDAGCNGGLQENAFDYIIKVGGIQSEADYPYTSGKGKVASCSVDTNKFVANMTKWVQVSDSPDGEDAILPYVMKNGPVTIGINANPMQDYIRGIDDPSPCSPINLNHAVLIVGYGTEAGTDYWLIKNSWGPSWGEQGYYRIVRGEDKCGLARDVVHSIV